MKKKSNEDFVELYFKFGEGHCSGCDMELHFSAIHHILNEGGAIKCGSCGKVIVKKEGDKNA